MKQTGCVAQLIVSVEFEVGWEAVSRPANGRVQVVFLSAAVQK